MLTGPAKRGDGSPMIEMHRARPEEAPGAAALWRAVFGDGDALIRRYYDLCASYDRQLALTEGGEVRSILSVPEMALSFPNGRTLRAGYIYALATRPGDRGKGYAAGLLRYAEALLRDGGCDCAVTVPAQRSLFRFFGTQGYAPAFSYLRAELTPADLPDDLPGKDALTIPTPGQYAALRRALLAGRFYADLGEAGAAFQHYLSRESGAGMYLLTLPGGDGGAAAELEGDCLTVKELLGADAAIPAAAALLLRRHSARRCVLRLPPWSAFPGESVPFGAVRWLFGRPSPWCPPGAGGYLGCAFD